MGGQLQDEGARLLAAAARARGVATADLFLPDRLRLAERERIVARDLLERLVRAIEDELRSSLAASFADADAIHAALSSAHVQLAVPLLARTEALHVADLVSVLLRRAEEHRLYRASRNDLSLSTLLADQDEAIAAEAMAVLVARSRRLDRFEDPVMARTELPAELQHRLVWTVAAALRRYLVEQHDVPPAVADAALASSATIMLAGYDEGDTLEARCMRLARLLRDAGRLNGSLIAVFLEGGTLPLFLAAVAARTGLSLAAVWELVSDPQARGPIFLLRLAGASRGEAGAAFDALRAQPSDAELADALDLFDTTDEDAARDAIALWGLDPAYRSALLRLGGSEAA